MRERISTLPNLEDARAITLGAALGGIPETRLRELNRVAENVYAWSRGEWPNPLSPAPMSPDLARRLAAAAILNGVETGPLFRSVALIHRIWGLELSTPGDLTLSARFSARLHGNAARSVQRERAAGRAPASPKTPRLPRTPVSAETAARARASLPANVEDISDETLWALAAVALGVRAMTRPAELLGLRVGDIAWAVPGAPSGSIRVSKTVTKTSASGTVFPVVVDPVQIESEGGQGCPVRLLRAWRSRRDRIWRDAGLDPDNPHSFVFGCVRNASRGGRKVGDRSTNAFLTRAVRRVYTLAHRTSGSDEVDLAGVSAYSIRHGAAQDLARVGVADSTIVALGGWREPSSASAYIGSRALALSYGSSSVAALPRVGETSLA